MSPEEVNFTIEEIDTIEEMQEYRFLLIISWVLKLTAIVTITLAIVYFMIR